MEPNTHLIRLVYASRATFPAGSDTVSLNADVARILNQSRRNNPAQGLVGALYFGDGCFFQCLEGPAEAVDGLYGRLPNDPRHRDLIVLSREAITRLSFSGWSMKFVPNAAVVREVLTRHGLRTFNPYEFSPQMLSDMVGLLLSGPDSAITETAERTGPTGLPDSSDVARQARTLAVIALVVSVLALAVAFLR